MMITCEQRGIEQKELQMLRDTRESPEEAKNWKILHWREGVAASLRRRML